MICFAGHLDHRWQRSPSRIEGGSAEAGFLSQLPPGKVQSGAGVGGTVATGSSSQTSLKGAQWAACLVP